MKQFATTTTAALFCIGTVGAQGASLSPELRSQLQAAQASTWYVDDDGVAPGSGTLADPYTSIQAAIDAAAGGDTVLVAPGTYFETIALVGKGVSVLSTEGSDWTTIDGEGAGSVVTFFGPSEHPMALEGFTVTDGSGSLRNGLSSGGGIASIESSPYLVDVVVTLNEAVLGGGVYSYASTMTMTECRVVDNTARTGFAPMGYGRGGGIYVLGLGGVTLEGCEVTGNTAGRGGGLYAEGSSFYMEDTLVAANVAMTRDLWGDVAEGGGVFARGSTFGIVTTRFLENLAYGYETRGGGARFCSSTEGYVQECEFVRNAVGDFLPHTPDFVGWGGGIAADSGITVTDTTFEGNHAPDAGGAIFGGGTYEGVTVFHNSARWGGGASVGTLAALGCGNLAVTGSTFYGNDATLGGGAVHGTVFVGDCELYGNTSSGFGGAAYGATLDGCSVHDNAVRSPDGQTPVFGGGAYACAMEGCRVFENVASGMGSAVGTGGGVAGANMQRCEVFDNEADLGGGAANSRVDRCTIYANAATVAGDGLYYSSLSAPAPAADAGSLAAATDSIYPYGAFARVSSSVVWANGSRQIVDETDAVLVTYTDVMGGWPGTGNADWDPYFWDADARDFHLKLYSYCIDSGDPSAPLDPDGSRADMGAVPFDPSYCGAPSTYCVAKPNSLGCAPSIGFSGSPSLTGADDFVVTATGVLNQRSGLLFWGYEATDEPFFGGTLCVQAPLVRTAVQGSGGSALPANDCSGSYAFHLTHGYLSAHSLGTGSTIYAQYYSRDPGFAWPDNVGTTNALRITICQ